MRRASMLSDLRFALRLLRKSPFSTATATLVSSALWGVSATDIVVFVAVPALLVVAALAAGYGPARRATRLDPIAVLRQA